MARLKAAASMRQEQQHFAQQVPQPKLFKHVPARLPPSHRAMADWLDAESAMYAPPVPASSSSGAAAAAQAAAGSGFVMDANTGRLVPLQASATQVPIPLNPAGFSHSCAKFSKPCRHEPLRCQIVQTLNPAGFRHTGANPSKPCTILPIRDISISCAKEEPDPSCYIQLQPLASQASLL